MKRLGMILLFLLVSHSGFSARSKPLATRTSEKNAVKQELSLTAGLQTVLDLEFEPCAEPADECIKVSNKGTVLVQRIKGKKQLVLMPVKKGESNITIRDENGDIKLIFKTIINENNLSRRVFELRELLRDIEGIDIRQMGDKIVVDGEVVVVSDLNRLYAVLSDDTYKGLVLNLVTVSPVGMQILAEKIQAEINKPNVKVRVFNGLFLIEGQVESRSEGDSIVQVARSMLQGFVVPTYGLDGKSPVEVKRLTVKDPIITRLTIAAEKPKPPEKIIRVSVAFVELAKDYLRNFGFSWIPSLETGGSISFGQSTTGGVTSEGTGSLAGTIGNLFPKLNSAQNAGYARILEESVLMTKSGTEAKLVRQLQIPVQTLTDKGLPNTSIVPVGPQISVTPTIMGQTEDVYLKIDFNYSGLAGKQTSVPVTMSHSYKSEIVVRNSESAAVVNAISNAVSTAFNKDPPGGASVSNPLFTLLRSKAFQKSKSQFVVFITPQIVESASSGTDDIKNKYGLKRKN